MSNIFYYYTLYIYLIDLISNHPVNLAAPFLSRYMVRTADQEFSTITIIKMNTTTNNNISVCIASISVVNSESFFEAYQDTAVGSNKLTIHTIVPPSISSEPYRKAMIAILFFRRILSLSSSPSIYFCDLTSTVAAYFGITTGAVEREAERIVDSVRPAFLHVENLQGISFLNSSGKGIQITDLNNRTVKLRESRFLGVNRIKIFLFCCSSTI